VHVALYRIAQEALNNVVKHARASTVDLTLRCAVAPTGGEREVELQIRDDGRGFDLNKVAPDHLGLGIMRERAEAIGARLEVETAAGGGTAVSLYWADSGAKRGGNR
jgi:signal transduction histidine kinase